MAWSERRRDSCCYAVVVLVMVAISLLATRPLLTSGRAVGGRLDAVQTYWGFWFIQQAVTAGNSIMHTRMLWWPDGTPLWFQTWDLPASVLANTLGVVVARPLAFNLTLFATFPLAGLAMYSLARGLFVSRTVACLVGVLYTFSTFHYAHAMAHPHVAAIFWPPLAALTVRRAILDDARARGRGLAIGVVFGLAALASVYQAVFCLLAAGAVACAEVGGALAWPALLKRAAAGSAVAAAIAGWLLIGMLHEYSREEYIGNHNAIQFSADAQAALMPNEVNWAGSRVENWRTWTGSAWESSASYLGWVSFLVGVGGSVVDRRARVYLAAAFAGWVLSLGPYLHVGGTIFRNLVMPYRLLEAAVPGVAFGGLPLRFSWLTLFGVSTGAGYCLDWLWRLGRPARAGAVIVVALATLETWPHAFAMTSHPTFEAAERLRDDSSMGAVLDLSEWTTALWNQTVHQHPIVSGYVSRLPRRLIDKAQREPWLDQLFPPPVGHFRNRDIRALSVTMSDLRSYGIRYVIVPVARAESLSALRMLEKGRTDESVLLEVPAE